MNERNISITEISKLAGVSIATVSRVINNNGRFSKETEDRVRRIIEENGYLPNMLAAGLRTGRVQVIGIIVPDITNEFFAQMTIELQKNLFYYGYSTLICNTNEDPEIEKRHLLMLKSQRINGLIYVSGKQIESKVRFNIPTVYIDRMPPNDRKLSNNVFIESDNEAGGYLATKKLLDGGCKKIAIIMYENDVSSHHNRLIGYQNALKEKSIPFDESLVSHVEKVDAQNGYLSTIAFVRNHDDIDGIFCTSDLLAQGSLKALIESCIAVPEAVKVIGFDNTSISMNGIIPFSSISQQTIELGKLGTDVLISMIDGAQPKEKKYTLPVELVERQSTKD